MPMSTLPPPPEDPPTESQDRERLAHEIEVELARIESRRLELTAALARLRQELDRDERLPGADPREGLSAHSAPAAKVALFKSLFRGREDIHARRFESKKTGRAGYQPVCQNEWVPGICEKPRIRCEACKQRAFVPLTDSALQNHLRGVDPTQAGPREITLGVYPLLSDDTCWFLAIDFDKSSWREDTSAFMETCRLKGIPATLERSRSGHGGHVWIFFSEPVPAATARRLGALLITTTMERRPEIGLDSYDRMFPNQDTLPRGGFGNLIALPLQRKPRERANSVFVDGSFIPYTDQWAFLASIRRLTRAEVEAFTEAADGDPECLGVRTPILDEEDDHPWLALPSGRRLDSQPQGPLPGQITLVIANQVFVPKEQLSPWLRNRIQRIAAFANPEFFQAQAMRLPTYNLPRIVSCSQDFPQHLAVPRGCLAELTELLRVFGIAVTVQDQRQSGTELSLSFAGALRPQQEAAAQALLAHDTGVLAAATAFGKTVLATHLIAARGVNTLVLVHRRQLLEQWIRALSQFLGLDPKAIGRIGAGKRHITGRLDVAMIQSLSRKGVVDDLVANYGHLVVDECHHISAVSFEQVLRQVRARYTLGLSATLVRKDGHHPIIWMQCGPIRFRVTDRGQSHGRPFNHRVVLRTTSFRQAHPPPESAAPDIQTLYGLLAEDVARNRLIAADVVAALAAGRCPIVLSERRDHVDRLAGLLGPQVKHLFVLAGGMGRRQTAAVHAAIAAVPGDEPRLILATGRFLGEGYDDARLDTLFLTLPISWRGTLAQYVGRLHRLNELKREVVVYDYADLEVPVLAKMCSRRRTGYKALGYGIDTATSQGALQLCAF